MSLHWYRPPRPSSDDFATYLEHLKPLGVRWETWAAPAVSYKFEDGELLAQIGCITVSTKSGLIRVWPYRDLGPAESRVLAASAQLAFEKPPSKSDGWVYIRKGVPRWSSNILVLVNERHGRIGAAVARHQISMEWEGLHAVGKAILASARTVT